MVAALGYFVDIYDLLLFSIVRVPSLKSLGLQPEAITEQGILLINFQMAGLLLGGILWGILGDRKGRIKVLFGSIFVYSLANLANAFVQGVPAYAACRFIAGLGLAGELGAGITLICEILPIQKRAYATAIMASVGISGAVVAGFLADVFDWRISYGIGGGLGLLLLALRLQAQESHMFLKISQKKETSGPIKAGNILGLFTNLRLLKKYFTVIGTGILFWFVVGILITFAPEFSTSLGLIEVPSSSLAVMFCYGGAMIGDLFSGLISQWLKSRRRAMMLYIFASGCVISFHILFPWPTLFGFYFKCGLLGLTAGYWALFVTLASESFGTNLRATVTTTAPNFVRGAVIPLTLIFRKLSPFGGLGMTALAMGLFLVVLSLFCVWRVEETFSKDLNFEEYA
jgi:MFS family permease